MRIKKTILITTISLIVSLSGCATVDNKDPLEGMNRGIYKFNDTADKAIVKPIAGAYKAVVPQPLRTGASNFFANISTVVSVINDLLQFKFSKAFTDSGRLIINSTFGVAGLIDVASMDGIPKANEDFGQTLGTWGLGSGAYVVLPFFGPSSLRDATGFVVDTLAFDPITYLQEPRTSNRTRGFQYLSIRSDLLPASDLVDEAALDPYVFMRDAYFQRRESLVSDGAIAKPSAEDADFYGEPSTEPLEVPKQTSEAVLPEISPVSLTPENEPAAWLAPRHVDEIAIPTA